MTRYYRSVNAGSAAMTWAQLTTVSTNVLNGQGWYDNALTVDPINKNRVYVGGWTSTASPCAAPVNSGMTLTRQSVWSNPSTASDYAHADHHVLMTVPNGGGFRLLDGSDGGVAFTDDIGTVSGSTYPTWVKTLNAYNTAQPYSADKRAGADQFITGLQDNGTWTSPTGSTAASAWNYRIGGDGFDTAWNQADANVVMGSLYYNRLFRSTNGGVSFAETSPGLTEKGTARSARSRRACSASRPTRTCSTWAARPARGAPTTSAATGRRARSTCLPAGTSPPLRLRLA